MGRFFVRITIIFVAIYLIIAYIIAQTIGVDILTNTYTLMFEMCVVIYAYDGGKYHCKYIKHVALSILLSDTITRLDYLFNFLSITAHNLIPIAFISIGISVSLFQAINYFIKVRRLKNGNTK